MDEGEPHVRRRGFFLHSDTTGEPDTGERENPEGLAVRVATHRRPVPRQIVSASTHTLTTARFGGSRSRTTAAHADHTDEGLPQIRSGSATGSRQRAHLHR